MAVGVFLGGIGVTETAECWWCKQYSVQDKGAITGGKGGEGGGVGKRGY